jgi:hypothetical protein
MTQVLSQEKRKIESTGDARPVDGSEATDLHQFGIFMASLNLKRKTVINYQTQKNSVHNCPAIK